MIDWGIFEKAVCDCLGRDISINKNPNQNDAIRSPIYQPLFIVAGPGSGKTTVITLRVLKLIFVDSIDPSNILVTTFTKKAASELRSRILGWGDQLRQFFINSNLPSHIKTQLQSLNFNRIITGTLDSISEEVLIDYREPGTPPPVIIEDFVSNALMIRVGLFNHGRHNDNRLKNYITRLRGSQFRLNVSEMSATLLEIKDRFFHDQINVQRYLANCPDPGAKIAWEAINDYIQELKSRNLFDFALLEQEFLIKLQSGTLNSFLSKIKFVLVDEYQDTNLLQEQIYFELAKAALKNGGSISVVGDDDQSLYRFRGATVDLFQSFPDRICNQLGVNPKIVYLSQNYRSTPTIVSFCNDFITLDQRFQSARVSNKPPIIPSRSEKYTNFPILGMFRDDVEELASDLARFIHGVVHGGGFQVQDHQGNQHLIRIHPRGSPADIALLFSSPREFDSQGKPRLPFLLRQELDQLTPPIRIFNPRGQNLQAIREVQILCGLILECLDPNSAIEKSIHNLPSYARDIFDNWRREARAFINRNPNPTKPISLRQFVNAWQKRIPLGVKEWREKEVPLVDLIYKLVTWLPNMQNDIEGIVYLEAIIRTVTQSALFSDFRSEIIVDPDDPDLEETSIREAIWNILVPLATGAIEVNEELLETLPNDRINIMSIHQAKGLEFPLVVVDVGSDFKKDHPAQAFKRFPKKGGQPCNMEDEFRNYSPLGPPSRGAIDRAFDDLIRQFFVAYSRAQDVLLIVGLNSVRDYIPNVATGWDRCENWHWKRGLPNLVHI